MPRCAWSWALLVCAATTFAACGHKTGKGAHDDESDSADDDAKTKKDTKSKKKASDSASAAVESSAAPTSSGAPAAAASATAAPTVPALEKRFPRDGLGLPESCPTDVWVMIEPAGRNTREAYYLVKGLGSPSPAAKGDVPGKFGVVQLARDYEATSSGQATTFARCSDPETCYELAAFLAHARSFPKPKVHCGKPTFAGSDETPADWQMWISTLDATEIGPSCARIAGCRYDKDPSLPARLVDSCAKAPGKQNLACAQKPTCAEVLSCLGTP